MTTKQDLFEKGDVRYYIKLTSGKYYVEGIKEDIIETRIIDHAGYYNEKKDALKQIERLETDVTLIKRKRIALERFGEELSEKALKNGVELGRKYVPANLGDYLTYTESGKQIKEYMFSSSHGSKQRYLHCVNLLDLEEANKLAKELEKEALKERTKRIKWDVLEVATIEEEVAI